MYYPDNSPHHTTQYTIYGLFVPTSFLNQLSCYHDDDVVVACSSSLVDRTRTIIIYLLWLYNLFYPRHTPHNIRFVCSYRFFLGFSIIVYTYSRDFFWIYSLLSLFHVQTLTNNISTLHGAWIGEIDVFHQFLSYSFYSNRTIGLPSLKEQDKQQASSSISFAFFTFCTFWVGTIRRHFFHLQPYH